MTIALKRPSDKQYVTWMGTKYGITVGQRESAGRMTVFESVVPAHQGPPIHVHHNEDEVIHVIEETYEFWLDGEITRIAPGHSIFLPRGVPHSFRVASDRDGRNVTILTPAGLEDFFLEAGNRQLQIPTDMPAVMELATRFGIEFKGPVDWAD
ncbi:cupin domain-containing protein [Rhizobium viscosum]|uniref:Quercetin dioxygenase-like cupin family protein n=1 Tax=Rhizobium viscosum TaxID=1673 RepID=A0ABR9J0D4_RHIVS|nr:cupin domain-containing protein [Rhizobium viscosum]MBE1508810.1 quercetin dioxygenase-like cupin family protein [Rhizobium viscosum]